MEKIKYSEAMYKSFVHILENYDDAFIIGQGLWSPWYVGSTMTDLEKKYGKHRIIDSPISENATTGIAIGAAMAGKKSIVVHPRMDFMLLAMDPLINQASNWSYLFNSEVKVPLVVRSIINRGGEQGAQHSQALQSFFHHIPGIKVVMPATSHDVQGLLLSSLEDNNPVMFIDDRWCYDELGLVETKPEPIKLGEAELYKEGKDLTIITYSYLVHEALKASTILEDESIDVEILNLRTIKPWDRKLVIESCTKTKRVVVADSCWIEGGVGAQISSYISSMLFQELLSPVIRVGLPNIPAPCSRSLEECYYPKSSTLAEACRLSVHKKDLAQVNHLSKEIPGLISY